jgi:hypothetical protein
VRTDGTDLQILDVKSSCTCVCVEQYETSLGCARQLRLRIIPMSEGRFNQRVVVVVNRDENNVVSFLVTGFFKKGVSHETFSG